MTSHVRPRESGASTNRPRLDADASSRSIIWAPVPPAPCSATTSGRGSPAAAAAAAAAGTRTSPSRPAPSPSGWTPGPRARAADEVPAEGRAVSRPRAPRDVRSTNDRLPPAAPGMHGSAPAELVQARVVDAEVVGDLVHDGHLHLLDDLVQGVADGEGRPHEDRDAVW